jgi:hypothetical protein
MMVLAILRVVMFPVIIRANRRPAPEQREAHHRERKRKGLYGDNGTARYNPSDSGGRNN